ncbi:hypothetical protein A2963_02680 [Candidatus Roizmanbacteria bacterium RIFCSPLOWO2_01_FULL_40_13]|nr:MAG: hypothetical protein A2963_02680 [Candidatus Roizmanbacteria bacterium RIFCSPLOWO2_01_FULL_40_13]
MQDQAENTKPEVKSSKKDSILRLITVLVAVAFIFLLFLFFQLRNKKQIQDEVIIEQYPTPVILQIGSLTLQKSDKNQSAEQNKALNIDVLANSGEKSIVGYDLVFTFTEDEFEVLTATSLLEDFSLYRIKEKDYFIVTGAKKLDTIASAIFDNTPVLRLTLKPKKKGELTLGLANNLNKERTQMVDEDTQVLFPQVSELKIDVK